MLENIEDIVSKYDSEVFAKLNKENMTKIIIFLLDAAALFNPS